MSLFWVSGSSREAWKALVEGLKGHRKFHLPGKSALLSPGLQAAQALGMWGEARQLHHYHHGTGVPSGLCQQSGVDTGWEAGPRGRGGCVRLGPKQQGSSSIRSLAWSAPESNLASIRMLQGETAWEGVSSCLKDSTPTRDTTALPPSPAGHSPSTPLVATAQCPGARNCPNGAKGSPFVSAMETVLDRTWKESHS